MRSDATYYADPALAPARRLQRAGDWAAALSLLPDGAAGAVLRAEILVDRHGWRIDPADEALAAIAAIAQAEPAAAAFLTAQLEYWRRLFKADGGPLGPDPVDEFARLEAQVDPGWGAFWHGVALELLRGDEASARNEYARARSAAVKVGDRLLESYAVRHLGYCLLDRDREAGLALLRRSLYLRAAVGARPHAVAAQAALVEAGVGEPDAAQLAEIVAAAAEELGLTWLKQEPEIAAATGAAPIDTDS